MNWKNYDWYVRNSTGGPGPNTFKSNNVSIDAQGNLVLQITKQNGQWTCAEAGLNKQLGYGEYIFTLASPIKYDKNVVAAGFTYGDDNNELDIEYSYWGGNTTNVGFTVQPAPYISKNNIEFNVPEGISGYKNIIHFYPNNDISFRIEDGNGIVLKSWGYTGTRVPNVNQTFIFNLWLFNGKAPTALSPQIMSVKDFVFVPQGQTPTPVPPLDIVAKAKLAGFTNTQAAFLTGNDYKTFINS